MVGTREVHESGEPRLRYMPGLDGLRAFAVIGVLLYHGDVSWMRGGYLGVDAFFVLSGFLITSLLLDESRRQGTIDLGRFWSRRARRLLPALLAVVAAVALYAAVAAEPSELDRIRREGLATLGYFANWGQIFSSASYFEGFGPPSPLRHTWSLAIEEQFYLVWPLVVFVALRVLRASPRALLVLVGALGAGSVLAMGLLYRPGADPTRVYYGTDTRAQSLLVGAGLAIVLAGVPLLTNRAFRTGLRFAAAVAGVALLLFWSRTHELAGWQYRGGFLLFASLVAVVIASVATDEHGPVARALSLRPLVAIGLISYGLYLWHWPVYVYLSADRTGLENAGLLAVRLAVTVALATASYVLLESPIRHGGLRGWRIRSLAPIAAVVAAVALVVSTAGPRPAGESEISAADLVPPRPASASEDVGVDSSPVTADPAARVMLVGDSMAHSLAPGLARAAAAHGFELWDASVPGCGLADELGERRVWDWEGVDENCLPPWRERWRAQVADYRPHVVVTIFGIHDSYDRRIDGIEYPFDSPEGAGLAEHDLREAMNALSSAGARVLMLTAPYYVIGWPQQIRIDRSPYNPAWIDRYNAAQRAVAEQLPDTVEVMDLNRFLSPDGEWTDTVGGADVRGVDRVHLSESGADLVSAWMTPEILKLAETDLTPDPSFGAG